jgi:hypothetical protein
MLGNNIIVEKLEYVFKLLEKDLNTIEKPCGTLLEKIRILLEGLDHCLKRLQS